MFGIQLQKTIFVISFAGALVLFIGVFVYAYISDTLNPAPKDTQAPFVQTLLPDSESSEPDTIAPDRPRLSSHAIEQWISATLSEVMTFDTPNFTDRVQNARRHFTQDGFRQYEDYLDRTELLKKLNDKNQRASLLIDGDILLLNEGAVEGVYRWLYDVPVMIGIVSRSSRSYVPGSQPIGQKLSIRMQITRAPTADDPNALLIESWEVRARKD